MHREICMWERLRQMHREGQRTSKLFHLFAAGAQDKTAKQMRKVLGLKRLKKQKAHMAYSALTSSLTQMGNATLNMANAVYVKPNLPIEAAFRTGLQDMYQAEWVLLLYLYFTVIVRATLFQASLGMEVNIAFNQASWSYFQGEEELMSASKCSKYCSCCFLLFLFLPPSLLSVLRGERGVERERWRGGGGALCFSFSFSSSFFFFSSSSFFFFFFLLLLVLFLSSSSSTTAAAAAAATTVINPVATIFTTKPPPSLPPTPPPLPPPPLQPPPPPLPSQMILLMLCLLLPSLKLP